MSVGSGIASSEAGLLAEGQRKRGRVDRVVCLAILVGFHVMTSKPKSRVANAVAGRRLSVAGEPDREIVITIGKPRPEPDPSVWECSYLVEGIPNARRKLSHGVDSLQAFQNAIQGVRNDLIASGLVLTWEGGEPGEVGFPRNVPTFEGSGFREKIERYMDRELEEFVRMAQARSKAMDK